MNILVAFDVRFLYDTEGSGWDFKSQMVVMLFVTSFLSQTVIGIRVLLYRPQRLFGREFKDAGIARKVFLWILFFLLCPIAPAIVIYLEKRRERNIRKQEKELLSMFRCVSPVFEVHLSYIAIFHHLPNFSGWRESLLSEKKLNKDDMKKAMETFKVREEEYLEKGRLRRLLVLSQRLDNVLQHTPQALIKILFILISLSSTAVPAVRGVEAVYNSLEVDEGFFARIQFRLSTVLSVVAVASGLYDVHMYTKHSSVPLIPGQVLLRLLYIVSAGTRVLCFVLLAAPYLGLYGLMEPYIMVVYIFACIHTLTIDFF